MADNRYKLILHMSDESDIEVEGEIVAPQGPQGPAGEGASIIVDSALSATSENPVQNKIIDAEFKKIRDEMAAISGSSIEPFVITAVFSYLFSNASKELDVTSTKYEHGEVQWYSSNGEAVSINLSKIGYVIELFDAVSASLQLRRDDYTNSHDTVDLGSISNENGGKFIDYSTGPYTKNTTIIFSLRFTDNLERKFSVDSVVKISFPVYYGAGERATDIVSEGTKEQTPSIKGKTRSIAIEDSAKYIWFLTTETIESITNNGFYAGFVLYDEIVIGDATYNCYRSTYPIIPGTYTFDIK